MKRLLLLSISLLMAVPLLSAVWSEDPSISEEERQVRREHNERLREKNLLGARLKGSGYQQYQVPEKGSDDSITDDSDDDIDFDDED